LVEKNLNVLAGEFSGPTPTVVVSVFGTSQSGKSTLLLLALRLTLGNEWAAAAQIEDVFLCGNESTAVTCGL
jgi:uridine kinase